MPVEIKLMAVCASCRTQEQVKVARKYLSLAMRVDPLINQRYYHNMLNQISRNLLIDLRPRLNFTRPAPKLRLTIIGDDNHADQ
jgi:hypothetical protein